MPYFRPLANAFPFRQLQRSSLNCRPHIVPSDRRARLRISTSQQRFQATTSAPPSATGSRSLLTRLKNLFLGTTVSIVFFLSYYYITDTRASIHRWLIIPSLRYLYPDPEDAHEVGNHTLKTLYSIGIHPRERGDVDSNGDLGVEVFGHVLQNPIGTSAGIDKHCDIPDALLAAGPAIVEIGGVTPLPQTGNPKPRVFRLPSQNALINRYGLNSEGSHHIAMRLRQRVREYAYAMGFGIDEEAERRVLDGEAGVPPGSLTEGKLLTVQIAKNKWTRDEDIEAVKADYVHCVDTLARYADIVVVNVSSPNTPGLRGLQKVEPLTEILTAVVGAAKQAQRKDPPKIMVKVSPDEDSDEEVRGICHAVSESGVDGVIVGNTTNKRPDPLPPGFTLPISEQRILQQEQGGYSGPQLFGRTVELVKRYRNTLDQEAVPLSRARKVIFATGGITNGAQALEVLNAGADVAQVYTALVYGGIGTISQIKLQMREELEARKRSSSSSRSRKAAAAAAANVRG